MFPQPWKILINPDPKLRKHATDFDVQKITTKEFQDFADDFAAFMVKSGGVGLAATQIGFDKRIIAIEEKDGIAVYVNPKIIKASSTLQESTEGCLSVPGVFGLVDRPKRIRVRAFNRHGRVVEFDANGFLATVFDHEIDHLNGVLFIDKAKKTVKERKGDIAV
ncbi:MAG: peptide deformylase [Patescibacteria group bacterium]